MVDSLNSRSGWVIAAIALAAVVAFLPALRNDFVHDDRLQVQELAAPSSAADWLKSPAQPWWPATHEKNIWRPLTRISILVQKSIHNNTGWPFYAVNIALHALASILLFLVARRVNMSILAAAFAALAFAVHPIHAEAVHQIVGRAEILSAIFVMLGLLVVPSSGGILNAGLRTLLASLCFALALASKESAIVYPFLLALIILNRDGWPALKRIQFWVIMACMGFVLFVFLLGKAAATGGLIESASSVPPHENLLAHMGFLQRLPASLGILFYAAMQLVLPMGLSPDYSAISLPVDTGWRWPLAWLGALVVIALSFYMIRNARRGRRGWMLAAAALAAWLPLSNLLFPIGVMTAERLWYLPSAPACLGIGAILSSLWSMQPSEFARTRSFRILPAALLISWLLTSLVYSRAWQTQAGYAEWTIRRFPESWRGRINMAGEDYRSKQFLDGVEQARIAVKVMPKIAIGWDWLGLNAAFAGPKHWAESESALRKALELDSRLAEAHRHLATLYEMQGRRADAIREYEAYLASGKAVHPDTVKQRMERLKSNQ